MLEKYKSNLKELRLDAGLTLEELAEATGLGKRTIITIEMMQVLIRQWVR